MSNYKCGLTGRVIDGECYALFLKRGTSEDWQDCRDTGFLEEYERGLFHPASHIFKAWSDEIRGTFNNVKGDVLNKYLPEGIETEYLYDLGIIFLIHKDAFEYIQNKEQFFLDISDFNLIENQIARCKRFAQEDVEFWKAQNLSNYCEAFHIHDDLMFYVLRDLKILTYALHSLGRIFIPSFSVSDVDGPPNFEMKMLEYMNDRTNQE